jgi:hypothetical protein
VGCAFDDPKAQSYKMKVERQSLIRCGK